jgi:hypothetical protein
MSGPQISGEISLDRRPCLRYPDVEIPDARAAMPVSVDELVAS